jgi:hypothetical protein
MPVILSYINGRSIQTESPSAGDTVLVDTGTNDVSLYMTPAATLATMTLQFPDDNHSIIGQQIEIWSSHEITALTCIGNPLGSPTVPVINNPPNTILANGYISFRRVGAGQWTGLQ